VEKFHPSTIFWSYRAGGVKISLGRPQRNRLRIPQGMRDREKERTEDSGGRVIVL